MSQPNLRYRYTDTDIRLAEDEFRETATEFLEWYPGEFEFLVRAKQVLEEQGNLDSLTISYIRGIMNCARNDTIWIPSRGWPAWAVTSSPHAKPKLRLVREPRILYVPLRFRFDYWINCHKQANYYHRIDHTKTEGIFYPADWWNENKRNSVQLSSAVAICGKDLQGYKPWVPAHVVIGPLELAEAISDLQYCPRCRGVE